MKIACVTRWVDGNGNTANGVRVANALRKLGHEVMIYDHSTHGPSHFAVLRSYLPDWVLVFGTLLSAEHRMKGWFQALRRNVPAQIVFWYFDIAHPKMKNSPWKFKALQSVLPHIDRLVTTDHSYAWEKHIKYLHLMQGVDEEEYIVPPEYPPDGQNGPESGVRTPQNGLSAYGRDVIMTGGVMPPFNERWAAINELRRYGLRVDVFGRDSGRRIDGRDFLVEHARSRMVLVPAPPSWTPGPYWSNRIYLAAATGTPCLVGWTPGIEKHYGEGEVVFYHNNAEMVRGAKQLMADPYLRKAVGLAGRERTLRDHTYKARTEDLMRFMEGI